MKRYLRIGATVLLLLTMTATVAGCVYVCTPVSCTDTSDIGRKLGVALFPVLAAIALVWQPIMYSCIMFFLWERKNGISP